MEFRILGSLDVLEGGRSIALGGHKQRALLVYLLLHRNEPVPTDRLVAELWGDAPPPTAAKTVHVYASRMRKALGDGRLEHRAGGYVLSVSPDDIDAERFDRLVAGAAGAEASQAAAALREALALWRGPALDDLRYEPFAEAEIARLEERRLHAYEERVDADLALGRHGELVGELEALVADHPFRERLIRQLMTALYRSGRQAEALEAYQNARRLLHDELGLEPTPALSRLQRQILAHDPELDPAAPIARRREDDIGRLHEADSKDVRPFRRRLSILGAGLVVAGLAAVTIGLSRSSETVVSLDANVVGLVNSESGRLGNQLPLGGRPAAIAAGGGFVWVASEATGRLSRIDPETPAVETLVVGSGPSGVAFGGGSVWVSRSDGRDVVQVDARNLRPVQTIGVGNGPVAVAVGSDAVWVANRIDGTVSRIGLGRGAVTKTIPVCANPVALDVGAGSVWVACEDEGRVLRIDPRSRSVVDSVSVGNGPAGIAVGEEGVWVANRRDGTASLIDPVTSSVVAAIHIGTSPASVAAGDGTVWVADEAGALARIDPGSHRVDKHLDVGSSPNGLALVDGSVWVTTLPSFNSHRGGVLRIEAAPLLCRCIDPAGPIDPTAAMVNSLLRDGLLAYRRIGGTGGRTLVGNLAIGVPAPTDRGKTYTLRLRQGLRFSNGKLVRPSDVRYSFERLVTMKPETRGFFGIVGEAMCSARPPDRCGLSSGIEVDDATGRIVIRLVRPDADFLYKLTVPSIVPAGTPLRLARAWQIPATGPYRVAGFDPDRGIQLERNPQFRVWSRDARPDGYPDVMRFYLDHDEARRIAAVEHGDADLVAELPAARLAGLLTRYPARLHADPGPSIDYMFLNSRVPPFDDVRVRRALNYAVDRTRIAQLVGGPVVASPTCQLLPPGVPGYRPSCPYTREPNSAGAWSAPDFQRARRLIASSRTRGMHIEVLAYDALDRPAYGRYFVRLLRRLGYRSSLRVIPRIVPEYVQYAGNPRNRAQIGTFGWFADFAAPSLFLRDVFSCASFRPRGHENLNLSEFCDRAIDAKMRRASTLQAFDRVRANALWGAVDRALAAQAAAVPLANRRRAVLVSARVGNYQFHPQGVTLLDQLWVR